MFLIVLFYIALYAYLGGLAFCVFVKLDFGVSHYDHVEDDYDIALIMSCLWPVTVLYVVGIITAKKIFKMEEDE